MGGEKTLFVLFNFIKVVIASMLVKIPFLVRLRSSPPLKTQSSAVKMFASLPSSHFSSTKGNVVPPIPFCSLAFRVAAPLRAANSISFRHNFSFTC